MLRGNWSVSRTSASNPCGVSTHAARSLRAAASTRLPKRVRISASAAGCAFHQSSDFSRAVAPSSGFVPNQNRSTSPGSPTVAVAQGLVRRDAVPDELLELFRFGKTVVLLARED